MTQFDNDIALSARGAGTYEALISGDWNVNIGPNGGYIAAIILNGLKTELGDSASQTRSITYHFLSASRPGLAHLSVSVEKRGRTLSTAIARLVQADRTIAIGIATFGSARDMFGFRELEPPAVAPAASIGPDLRMGPQMHGHVPFRDQYDQRLAIGPTPPDSSPQGRVGGWTRFREPREIDDLAIVAISDSWYPSIMARSLPERVHAPTVDHTVHFVQSLPIATIAADDFILVEFETRIANEGYLIEDGRIWSANGDLIATSRQLAFMMHYDD